MRLWFVKVRNSTPKIVAIDTGGHQARLRARRDALVTDHMNLVRGIAVNVSKRLPPSFDVEDLVGVGMIALVQAADRYRPSKTMAPRFPLTLACELLGRCWIPPAGSVTAIRR